MLQLRGRQTVVLRLALLVFLRASSPLLKLLFMVAGISARTPDM